VGRLSCDRSLHYYSKRSAGGSSPCSCHSRRACVHGTRLPCRRTETLSTPSMRNYATPTQTPSRSFNSLSAKNAGFAAETVVQLQVRPSMETSGRSQPACLWVEQRGPETPDVQVEESSFYACLETERGCGPRLTLTNSTQRLYSHYFLCCGAVPRYCGRMPVRYSSGFIGLCPCALGLVGHRRQHALDARSARAVCLEFFQESGCDSSAGGLGSWA